MSHIISSTSVGYICAAAILITAIVSCGESNVSDEAVKAQTEACAKINQKPYISLTPGQILLDCRAPEPASADVQPR